MSRLPRFQVWLAGVAALGFAVRVVYGLAFAPKLPIDAEGYRALARQVADGHGYASPLGSMIAGHPVPTAHHPPLLPTYLALWDTLGIDSADGHRIACSLLGAGTVVLLGLLGRRLAGDRAGLIAASVAALYPPLFVGDASVISESLYALLVVLVLLMAYRFLDRPRLLEAGVLGAVIGLATLTRTDGLFLLLLLALPLAWSASRGRRLLSFGVCAAAMVVVLAPWLIRNLSAFDTFPLLSTNGGFTALASNCAATYSGRSIGWVSHRCAWKSPCNEIAGEVHQANCMQREAASYARRHASRVPLVMLARAERAWDIYDAPNNLHYSRYSWARPTALGIAGLIVYVLLVPLAIHGALLLYRRGVPLLPLGSTALMAVLVPAISFGFSRYRLVAEPAIVALAAVSLAAAATLVLGARAETGAMRRTPMR